MAEIKQKVKNFSKSKLSFPTPHLLTMQLETWEDFWKVRVKELLEEISPIRDYTSKEFELWFGDYKLSAPNYKNGLEAKKNNDSLEASLRVKVKLVNLKTKEAKEQEVFLADFPLMTERGTFVLNGVERVAIAQLIRSPGVFFTSNVIGGRHFFGAKIIPNRGAWLEIETDASGFIGIKIDRKRKVAATTMLRAFGVTGDQSLKELFQDVDNDPEIKYLEETIKKDSSHNQAEALVEIYQRLRPGDLVTPETAKELIESMFFNFERYDLSRVGRWRMNQRFRALKGDIKKAKSDEDIDIKDRVLRPEDIITIIHEVI